MARFTGFTGKSVFDTTKLDVSRLKALDGHPAYSLEEGLAQTYQWFLDNIDSARFA